MHYFDSNKTRIDTSPAFAVGTTPEAAFNVVYGENGDIIQLTLPTYLSTSVVYIRLIAHDFNEKSIVTVNETIT